MKKHHKALIMFLAVASACGGNDDDDTLTNDDDDSTASVMPESWTVIAPSGAPEGVAWAADDLEKHLGQMGLDVGRFNETITNCEPGQGRVLLAGAGGAEPRFDAPPVNDQTWSIHETRCDDGEGQLGSVVLLSGNGLLGSQYAAYEWLHALGVRFFHPEQEFVPESPRWLDEELHMEKTPAFRWRSVSLHLTHPLELGDIFRLNKPEYLDEARRFMEWQVKNLASYGTEGYGDGELENYGLRRGLPRSSGISLYGRQQGSSGILDPDDPRSEDQQIADAIDERLASPGEYPVQFFGVNYQATEFTPMPDDQVVSNLTFIAEYMKEHYPDVRLQGTYHGTHQPPSPKYGINPNGLLKVAGDNFGAQLHTLMFYDLFRPAPVYGNEDFHYFYEFMEEEYQRRPIWYFPESAWWLTFDIAVPLYLPITIEARSRDIQGIKQFLSGKLDGHRVFGTGHEWGYWQNEYCSFRMAADLDYDWLDCIADIASATGGAAGEVYDVLKTAVEQQQTVMFDKTMLPWLVGSDTETEAAYALGIVFHPLPPLPDVILGWTRTEAEAWKTDILPRLKKMDEDYAAWVALLNAVQSIVPENGEPWFREIRDGLEANGLRARHSWQVYGALVDFRLARLDGDEEAEAAAWTQLEAGQATTQDVLTVIHRREQDYRYLPLERSIAGGPNLDEDDNWSIYSYRYLGRTHIGFYYTRIDGLAQDAMNGASAGERVQVTDTLLGPGETLEAEFVGEAYERITIDFGDGEGTVLEGTTQVSHAYAAPGFYTVHADAEAGGETVEIEFEAAVVAMQYQTGRTGAVTVPPAGAQIINPLLPGIVFGPVAGGEAVVGVDLTGGGLIGMDRWYRLNENANGVLFQTQPARLTVPVASGGKVLTSVVMDEAVFTLADATAHPTLAGMMEIESLIAAVVEVGGFEPVGARTLIAGILGYTPDTLPEQVPFEIQWTLKAP